MSHLSNEWAQLMPQLPHLKIALQFSVHLLHEAAFIKWLEKWCPKENYLLGLKMEEKVKKAKKREF